MQENMEGCRGNGTDRFGCQGVYHSQGDVYVRFDAALNVGIWIRSNALGCWSMAFPPTLFRRPTPDKVSYSENTLSGR